MHEDEINILQLLPLSLKLLNRCEAHFGCLEVRARKRDLCPSVGETSVLHLLSQLFAFRKPEDLQHLGAMIFLTAPLRQCCPTEILGDLSGALLKELLKELLKVT